MKTIIKMDNNNELRKLIESEVVSRMRYDEMIKRMESIESNVKNITSILNKLYYAVGGWIICKICVSMLTQNIEK